MMQRTLWIWSAVPLIVVCGVCSSAPPAEKPESITRTYPVADLVIPTSSVKLSAVRTNEEVPAAPKPEFEPLIRHLKKLTGADNWTADRDEISETPETLSLVVRQSPAIQEQIREELARLRHEMDLQVAQALTVITGTRSEIEALATAFPGELGLAEQKELREKSQKSLSLKTVADMKITTFNRQVATLKFGSKLLLTHAVVAKDRRSVQFKISYAPQDNLAELVSSCRTVSIHDGRAVAIRFEASREVGVIPPSADAEECLVIVAPRIIVQEEEETKITTVAKPLRKN